jgi:hypothetical protein
LVGVCRTSPASPKAHVNECLSNQNEKFGLCQLILAEQV